VNFKKTGERKLGKECPQSMGNYTYIKRFLGSQRKKGNGHEAMGKGRERKFGVRRKTKDLYHRKGAKAGAAESMGICPRET